jgi:DNA-binding response OmpR family regulator
MNAIAAAAVKRRPRVLLVDDDELIGEGLRDLLELEGIELFLHHSLITLPLEIRCIDPDLILLDLSMPALPGTALLEAGAHQVLRTDAPILLFSGRGAGELSSLVKRFGMQGYIAKGGDIGDLLARIKAALPDAAGMTDCQPCDSPSSSAARIARMSSGVEIGFSTNRTRVDRAA